jgi:hypothetical protein
MHIHDKPTNMRIRTLWLAIVLKPQVFILCPLPDVEQRRPTSTFRLGTLCRVSSDC